MATKYADFDLATGNNDGSDWTNAWKTMADAIAGSNSAPPAAGDTVYCRGTDTTAAAVTNNLAGNETNGFIKWIGVNASGVNDGTRAVIDRNGGASNVYNLTGNYNYHENFRFTNGINNYQCNVAGAASVWVNCSADTGAGAHGFFIAQGRNAFFRCVAYGLGGTGFYCNQYPIKMFFCCSRDNTGDGFLCTTNYYGDLYGCVAYDNGDQGFQDVCATCVLINCVADANGSTGISLRSGSQMEWSVILGCRVTNHSGAGDIGIDFNTELGLYGWNALDGNTDHIADSSIAMPIPNNGAATNSELNENGAGGGDTLQGYVSVTEGAEDYSTAYTGATDPHLRRTAITIPTS